MGDGAAFVYFIYLVSCVRGYLSLRVCPYCQPNENQISQEMNGCFIFYTEMFENDRVGVPIQCI